MAAQMATRRIAIATSCRLGGKRRARIPFPMTRPNRHDKNTFEDAEKVTVKPFDAVRVTETGLKMTLPACSVVEVTIRG